MNDKVYVLVSVLNMLFWLIANLAFGMFITWKLSCLFYLAWIFLIPIGVAISHYAGLDIAGRMIL